MSAAAPCAQRAVAVRQQAEPLGSTIACRSAGSSLALICSTDGRMPCAHPLPRMACHATQPSHHGAAALVVTDLPRLVAVAWRDQSLHPETAVWVLAGSRLVRKDHHRRELPGNQWDQMRARHSNATGLRCSCRVDHTCCGGGKTGWA